MGTIVIIYPPWTNVSEACRHPRLTSFGGPNRFRGSQFCLYSFRHKAACPVHLREGRLVLKCACLSTSSSLLCSLLLLLLPLSQRPAFIWFFSFLFICFLNKIKSSKSERGRNPGLFYKSLVARFLHNDLHWIKRSPLFLSPHSLYDHAATLSTFCFSLAFHMYISMVDLAL